MRRSHLIGFNWVTIASAAIGGVARADEPATPLFQRAGFDHSGGVLLTINADARMALKSQTGRKQLELPIDAHAELTLEMERFEVVRSGARFVRAAAGRQEPLPEPDVLLLRGSVAGQIGSHAFLALTSTANGRGCISLITGERWFISSVNRPNDDEPRADLVIHRARGVDGPGAASICDYCEPSALDGTTEGQLSATDGSSSPKLPVARGLKAVVLAVDGDQRFAQLFATESAALDYLVMLTGAVSDIYQRDLGLEILLDFARVWPDGGEPFDPDSFASFRNHWLNNEDLTGLNVIHLCSGRRYSAGGSAELGNPCTGVWFGISRYMLGAFPLTEFSEPNLGNWDIEVVAHEIGHNMGSLHTHAFQPPIDMCASGANQRSDIMSYCLTRPGGLLNTDMRFHRRVQDVIAGNTHPVVGPCSLFYDCNRNGIDDALDIAHSTSVDVNVDGVPDECQDCDGNGTLDPQQIAAGAPDVNGNGIPDSCEPDHNHNEIPDRWEIAQGLAPDLNGNYVPDVVEPDCDSDGVPDFQEIADGLETDLDRNSVPDSCQDCNHNGVPNWIDVDRQFNMYIGQTGASVREYHADSGVVIQEFSAGAIGAYDLTFGPDRQLYVTSFWDHRIVRINVDTGVASDFVTTGAGGLSGPSALAFGPDGNLYVSSQNTGTVIRYDGATGAVMGTFVAAGGGTGSGPGSPAVVQPWDLTFGPIGNLFVISSDNRVLEYNGVTGAFVRVFVSSVGMLNGPRGMAFLDDGSLLVTNYLGNNITHHGPNGAFLGQFNDDYAMNQPWGIAVGPRGYVYVGRVAIPASVIEYDPDTGRFARPFVQADDLLVQPTSFAFRPASPHDRNGNGLPDSCDGLPCAADVVPDGVINADDLAAVLQAWGNTGGPADINFDNRVNIEDLLAVINSWGPCS